ncbi:MAG: exo-alpha-sialidase [Bacteroidetes bacterium]|nr:MAG: exo-alpha-sialidase [Bacteroidota bacterium]
MRKVTSFILLLILIGCTSKKEEASYQKADLWTAGVGEHNNCRIPSLIVSPAGTVLAFCEGREGGDSGDINLLMKRSDDNGKTWSQEQIIWDDRSNSCGNPCPVVDEETGRIWLFMTWNDGDDHETKIIQKTSKYARLPYSCYSDDDGITWSTPTDMSATCRDTTWGWYATGPGFGIQIKKGTYKGRLIIPANHSYDDPEGNKGGGTFSYGSHVLFSDDHGENWKMSQSIKPGCNESQLTELSDGTLLMNMRSYNGPKSRAISTSKDGGASWSVISHDPQLVESRCQASILNFGEFLDHEMQLFTNPAVPNGRTHLTLKTSFDDCKSWSNSKLIYAGPAAYSCLTRLANGKIGIFFEAGTERLYEKLVFVSFDADEIFKEGELLSLV